VPTRALFDRYCVACHNDRIRRGDLSLDNVDLAHPAAPAATLEKVIRKLRAGLMPPARRPRPDEATVAAFVEGLEREIDRAAAAADPARSTFDGTTPLMVSAGIGWRGNFSQTVPDSWMKAVRFLMEIGADVNAVDTNGYTALHGAAALGNNEMVEFLVARGAAVNAISGAGNSPADMAFGPLRVFIQKPDTADLLVGLGASFQDDCRSDQCVDGKFFGGAVTTPR